MTGVQLQEALRLEKNVLDAAAEALRTTGKVVEKNGRLGLAEHREQFSAEEGKRLEAVEGMLRRKLFAPPDAEEIARELRLDAKKLERTLAILIEHGRVVSVAEGLFFHAEAIERARQILTDFLRKEGELESVKFKYLLETSRKFAIPLLDYFDRIGVTARRGYTRYLKEK
jgi:selenocysteine-specific elongation factor